jgi:parvulin-like peptidyl-prolyl isomerase
VAEVDGVPVRVSEVGRFLFRYRAEVALEILNQVLDARILEADAARLGIEVPGEEVRARVEKEVRAQRDHVRVQYGPDTTLEGFLAERFGFTLESYRGDLAALFRVLALKDRVVRYEAAREDRIRIRVLVVKDEETAREAAARLREGADFTALARQVSLGPAAEDLPPYRREDIRPAALADELFALEPGAVSRPVRVAKDGKEVFEVFKVIGKSAARDLPWAALREEVEKGIAERPVGLEEYLQWARRARERHGVRFHLEPAAPPEGAGAATGPGEGR